MHHTLLINVQDLFFKNYYFLGYYGPGCSQDSSLKSTEIQEGLYTKREITKDYTLFWRVLRDTNEIEMAIRIKGII